ncbi:MAG: hypothetical protein Q7K39_01775 [Candidatus Magasanikbacteria bacterium]|nr:hypothetical protein [Candidatus Magasanikbacteria bacterium]
MVLRAMEGGGRKEAKKKQEEPEINFGHSLASAVKNDPLKLPPLFLANRHNALRDAINKRDAKNEINSTQTKILSDAFMADSMRDADVQAGHFAQATDIEGRRRAVEMFQLTIKEMRDYSKTKRLGLEEILSQIS